MSTGRVRAADSSSRSARLLWTARALLGRWCGLGADLGRRRACGARRAVYVKPRGRLGSAYVAFIKPFRYLVVYPALMRYIERAWNRPVPTAVGAAA